YDVTGGRYEERDHHAVGSGSVFARGSLKKLYRPGLDCTDAVVASIEALYDAADDDSATGGPDLTRRIFPVIAVADASGVRMLEEAEVGGVVERVVAARLTSPDGPRANLPGANS
ncbi:MAG: proteasome subunit beta, partial [Candidatus Nanopelagicales bacterium]